MLPSRFTTKAALAEAYGVSLPTVETWLSRGCPHERRGRRYAFELDAVARWRAERLVQQSKPNRAGRLLSPEAKKWLDDLMLSEDELVHWLHPERRMSFDEYAKHAGITEDELFDLLLYGLPIVAPAALAGEDPPRCIPVAHADRFRTLLAVWVEALGGNGSNLSIASEIKRLRGYPSSAPEGSAEDEDQADLFDGGEGSA